MVQHNSGKAVQLYSSTVVQLYKVELWSSTVAQLYSSTGVQLTSCTTGLGHAAGSLVVVRGDRAASGAVEILQTALGRQDGRVAGDLGDLDRERAGGGGARAA